MRQTAVRQTAVRQGVLSAVVACAFVLVVAACGSGSDLAGTSANAGGPGLGENATLGEGSTSSTEVVAEPAETTPTTEATTTTGPDATADNTIAEDGIAEGTEVDAFDVRVGDCFDMPDGLLIDTVVATACTNPHDSQAFRIFDISGFDVLPTPTEMEDIVIEGCLGAFEEFIGVPYADSILTLTWFEPSQDTWDQLGDREIVCIATNETEALTQDLTGSGI